MEAERTPLVLMLTERCERARTPARVVFSSGYSEMRDGGAVAYRQEAAPRTVKSRAGAVPHTRHFRSTGLAVAPRQVVEGKGHTSPPNTNRGIEATAKRFSSVTGR